MRMVDDSRVDIPFNNLEVRYEIILLALVANKSTIDRLTYPDICIYVDVEPFIGSIGIKVNNISPLLTTLFQMFLDNNVCIKTCC